ncbi:MAG: HD domain-containing protein [Candidatus Marinimicrobia bacterium]|nr:HD domain-containing protein [Candidatus Neomarinimicrobiota bacterium]MCF7905294.1 HD domain-containing protein [Candidatus Neomarinimicrobiota bacterium]
MKKRAFKTEPAQLLSSLENIYQLKTLSRSGWVQSGFPVEKVESIASHSYGMAMLVLYLEPELQVQGIDVDRALRMALIHDTAESITGDITPADGVLLDDKFSAESEAITTIYKQLGNGNRFRELWDEFENGQSQEAQLVKRIDKLDMLVQAYFYEKAFKIRLDSFWEGMDALFADSESEPLYIHMRNKR